MKIKQTARPITVGPKHHFFGYYDKFQVDGSGRKMLGLELDFMDRMPTANDTVRVGYIDLDRGPTFHEVAETKAWCWQQSCMLQWLPTEPSRKIIFNVREDHSLASCILDIGTGSRQIIPRPIYTLTSDGSSALSVNFARLAKLRPGYGYEGVVDPWQEEGAPAADGIYKVDMVTGESRLIISLKQIADFSMRAADRNQFHWFNHLLFNRSGTRFIFLHRWKSPASGWKTRLFTAAADGSDIHLLNDHDMTSHFYWRDDHTVVAWANRRETGRHYYFFDDTSGAVEMLAPAKLTQDGHMSYRPQGEWMVTDTYPDTADRCRRLLLFHEPSDNLLELGKYYADPQYDGFHRCDLHPRWSRDGNMITFDSIHEGRRQMYTLDVSAITNR